MRTRRNESPLVYAAGVLLVVVLLAAVNVPAHAATADPRIGTPDQLKTTPEPTAAQLNRQMQGPRVSPPVHATEPESRVAQPDTPEQADPEAVAAALDVEKQTEARAAHHVAPGRSTTLLGLSLTAAILGIICAGGMLIVRMGPKPPSTTQSDG